MHTYACGISSLNYSQVVLSGKINLKSKRSTLLFVHVNLIFFRSSKRRRIICSTQRCTDRQTLLMVRVKYDDRRTAENIKQRAKKVVSGSHVLVDFAIGLGNSVINLPDGQVNFFEEFKLQKNCRVWNQFAHQNVFWASWNDIWASKC